MKVHEFIAKHKIKESRMRIYDAELEDEVYGIYEMGLYRDCEVVRAFWHICGIYQRKNERLYAVLA